MFAGLSSKRADIVNPRVLRLGSGGMSFMWWLVSLWTDGTGAFLVILVYLWISFIAIKSLTFQMNIVTIL